MLKGNQYKLTLLSLSFKPERKAPRLKLYRIWWRIRVRVKVKVSFPLGRRSFSFLPIVVRCHFSTFHSSTHPAAPTTKGRLRLASDAVFQSKADYTRVLEFLHPKVSFLQGLLVR